MDKLKSKVDHFNGLIDKRQNELLKNPFSSNWSRLRDDKTTFKLKFVKIFIYI